MANLYRIGRYIPTSLFNYRSMQYRFAGLMVVNAPAPTRTAAPMQRYCCSFRTHRAPERIDNSLNWVVHL